MCSGRRCSILGACAEARRALVHLDVNVPSARIGNDHFAGSRARPGDRQIAVHRGDPQTEVLALVVGSAQRNEIEQHGPATRVGVGVVELDEVVEFGVFGRFPALRESADPVQCDDLFTKPLGYSISQRPRRWGRISAVPAGIDRRCGIVW